MTAFAMTPEMRAELTRQRRRNAIVRSCAASDKDGVGRRIARATMREFERAPDTPIDVARRTLQRMGYRPVHNASVTGGSADHWVCGSRLLTTAEMLELAR